MSSNTPNEASSEAMPNPQDDRSGAPDAPTQEQRDEAERVQEEAAHERETQKGYQ